MNVNQKTGLVPVKLLVNFQNCNQYEVAGFKPETAQELVDKKKAEFFTGEKTKPNVEPKPADK